MRGEPYITVAAAAAHYFKGYTDRQVREMARAGEFGPKLVRTGKQWLIPEAGILKYLERHTIGLDLASGRIPDPHATPDRLRNLVSFRK